MKLQKEESVFNLNRVHTCLFWKNLYLNWFTLILMFDDDWTRNLSSLDCLGFISKVKRSTRARISEVLQQIRKEKCTRMLL